jgi:hypothetical protein
VLALEWTTANPVPPSNRSGQELLGELVRHLTKNKNPTVAEPGT